MSDRDRLARVGYEAMLKLIRENPDIPGYGAFSDPETAALIGAWENQCDKLKEDWRVVADAIECAVLAGFCGGGER